MRQFWSRVGRHPVSLRPRLPELEARALGLLRNPGVTVTALHAGPAAAAETSLRACLGMGAGRLVLLDIAPQHDPLPNLAAWLRAQTSDVILAGERAETGEGSGMAPFWLAEQLGYALVTRAVGLERVGSRVRVLQTLPGGRRRVLETELPTVVVVDRTAPPAPLCAIGPAMRGVVQQEPGAVSDIDLFSGWAARPSRKRPRRLTPLGTGPGDADSRQELIDPDPVAAADAILDFLEREALFTPVAPLPETV